MSFSRLHKIVAYLISGLGLGALSLGVELSPLVVTLIVIGYVASYFAEGPVLGWRGYSSAWTAAVVALFVLQVFRGVIGEPTLAMAIEFAAFLQISRLFNRRGANDYQQIAILAFVHLVAATVLSTSASYALVFAGFVIVTPWMLALSHLRKEIEGNYPVADVTEGPALGAIRRVLASKRVIGPRFLAHTALLAVPLFVMTLAIFVLIPRVGKGFLDMHRRGGQPVAGFGNQIELGGFGVIRDDPTVVLRVTPLPSIDPKAARAALRLRGTSFDHYDGRRWTRSPTDARRLSSTRGVYEVQRWPRPAEDERYRIVLDPLDEPVIFLPEGTVALSIDPRFRDGKPRGRTVLRSQGLDLRYGDPDDLGLVYTAYVSSTRTAVESGQLKPEERASYLQVPPGHERVAALARRVAAPAAGDLERVARVVRYLRDSGRFRYTLEQPDVGEQPPLQAFLLDVKRGHCEYFSSALAIMLRAIGIPARNVTGFVGGRYNAYGEYYALRQGDAHSWVEAFVEGRGWLTFDPTPPARATAAVDEGAWAHVHALVDALRTQWMTSIVAYDLRTQTDLLRRMARWARSLRSEASSGKAPNAPGDTQKWQDAGALRWLLAVLAAAALAALAWRLWRRRRAPSPLPRQARRAVELYRELEAALARRGHPRAPSETPWEQVQRLSCANFAELDDVREVTQRYMEARFGNRTLDADELSRLRQRVARVRKGVGRAA